MLTDNLFDSHSDIRMLIPFAAIACGVMQAANCLMLTSHREAPGVCDMVYCPGFSFWSGITCPVGIDWWIRHLH